MNDKFEFITDPSEIDQYPLGGEITHNGFPGIVNEVEFSHFHERARLTVKGIYGSNDGGMIRGLTCEELATIPDKGDGHDWRPSDSITNKTHWVACLRCQSCLDTGIPITTKERAAMEAEIVEAQDYVDSIRR